MRIQSERLASTLTPGSYILRSPDLKSIINPQLLYTEAIALAYQGHIEGVIIPSGRLKYLRLLNEDERPEPPPKPESYDSNSSTAFTQSNMGVYRERTCQVVVKESVGHRYVESRGEVSGFVYTHCALRSR